MGGRGDYSFPNLSLAVHNFYVQLTDEGLDLIKVVLHVLYLRLIGSLIDIDLFATCQSRQLLL